MDDVISKCNNYSNFHVLLGNHEWAHITCKDIFKSYRNERLIFEALVEYEKGSLQPTLDSYIEFFKSLPFFLKTDNGLFLSHAGPAKNINSLDDFNEIFSDDYENNLLYDFLWNRYQVNYDKKVVSNFLNLVESNCMIIGHNPVESYLIFGKQIIISSSYKTNKKTYLNIDLSKNIENIEDLMGYIEFLE